MRQFVADASHELRTPLTTIAGYTELARRRPDDPAHHADRARQGRGGVGADDRRWSRTCCCSPGSTPAGRSSAHAVDLSRLLVEAVSDARVVDPGPPLAARPARGVDRGRPATPQRLHQVVTNLLTNARKYTPAGTTVTVSAHGRAGSPCTTTGPASRRAWPSTPFERFARGDAARTRGDAGGAGLGLALVQAIVTAHGGTVCLRSRPGDTEVAVSLPA